MALSTKIKAAWSQRRVLPSVLKASSPSYSQYGEDIVFDRLMKPGRTGTYVDVGANHPVSGSNTFRLYNRGWKGIAIDPNPQFAADFRKYRPRDHYLTEGVSLAEENLIYFRFRADVYNTLDPSRAAGLVEQGQVLIGQQNVRCRPLSTIVDELIPEEQIDLLNVDCEGFDLQVIQSLDLRRHRPTVLMVEDYKAYKSFHFGAEAQTFEQFLRDHEYAPIAQTAWSAIFVAEDWRDLFKRSRAFREERLRNGYMPGQIQAPVTS